VTLDLDAMRDRDRWAIARMRPSDPPDDWATNPSLKAYNAYRERAWFDAEHDRRTLLQAIISCTRCSEPMLAQDPDNTADNDQLEVCPRCTRAIYTEDIG
jgi:formylmethanofuran dehydrogenase subunit E